MQAPTVTGIQWRAWILGVGVIGLGISGAFDLSKQHHRSKTLKSPWFFVSKVVLVLP
jgi:hypothetical protein